MDAALVKQHATVVANLMRTGACGVMGEPLYPDGHRWLTFCFLPARHDGTLHGHREGPWFDLPLRPEA